MRRKAEEERMAKEEEERRERQKVTTILALNVRQFTPVYYYLLRMCEHDI